MVSAAQTTFRGFLQLNPANITARGELTRLNTAAMLLLAGNPQLAVMGYWDVGNGTTGLFLNDDHPHSLCSNVIVELPNMMTIPVIPYAILLITSLLFVSLSYAHTLPLDKALPRWDDLSGVWVLYSAEGLHSEVMQKIRGRFWVGDNRAAATQHEGPVIMTWHKPPHSGKCFGSGVYFRIGLHALPV
jgi:hypothetical protein